MSVQPTQVLCFCSSFLNSGRGPGEARSGRRTAGAEARARESGFHPQQGSSDLRRVRWRHARHGSGVSEGDADGDGGYHGDGLGVRQKAPPPQVVGTWAGGRQRRSAEEKPGAGGAGRGGVSKELGRQVCVCSRDVCADAVAPGQPPRRLGMERGWGCPPPSRQSIYIQHEKCQHPGYMWVT